MRSLKKCEKEGCDNMHFNKKFCCKEHCKESVTKIQKKNDHPWRNKSFSHRYI